MYLWSTAMTSGISFVLLCVYVCLVRPMRRERRSIFQAYTASSAALLGNEISFFFQKKEETILKRGNCDLSNSMRL